MDSIKGVSLGLGVAGLVLGGVIGYAVAETGNDDVAQTTQVPQEVTVEGVTEEASELRVDLSAELREHVSLAAAALSSAYENGVEDERTTAAVAELDENSTAVADMIGSVLPDSRDQFLEQWRDHINYFIDYTVGIKASDTNATDQALEDLANYSETASQFYGENIEGLSAEDVQPLLVEHRDLLVDAIDAFAEGDYVTFYQKEAEASNQIGEIANILAVAIADQFLTN